MLPQNNAVFSRYCCLTYNIVTDIAGLDNIVTDHVES